MENPRGKSDENSEISKTFPTPLIVTGTKNFGVNEDVDVVCRVHSNVFWHHFLVILSAFLK